MIELRRVNADNIWELVHLKVREDQESFIANNVQSILEAYTTIIDGGVALPFGIYNGDMPVGFVMFGYGVIEGQDDPSIADGNYCIWRFMIGAEHQGYGYAKAGMTAALAYLRTYPCGPAEYCWLSYEPENISAKTLYASFGFTENREKTEGETVAIKKL